VRKAILIPRGEVKIVLVLFALPAFGVAVLIVQALIPGPSAAQAAPSGAAS
jgi:hypothetical protein